MENELEEPDRLASASASMTYVAPPHTPGLDREPHSPRKEHAGKCTSVRREYIETFIRQNEPLNYRILHHYQVVDGDGRLPSRKAMVWKAAQGTNSGQDDKYVRQSVYRSTYEASCAH